MINKIKLIQWILVFSTTFVISTNCQASGNAAEFFTEPGVISAKLSPNGRFVAMLDGIKKDQKLVLYDNHSKNSKTLLKLSEFSKQEASVRSISWIDDQHVAAQFIKLTTGIKNLVDTRIIKYLLIIKLPDQDNNEAEILKVRTPGWLVNPLVNDEGAFLYAKSGIYSKIYRIQVDKLLSHQQKRTKLMRKDGGQFVKSNEVASVNGFATRWFFNSSGVVSSVLNYSPNGELHLNAIDNKGEIKIIKKWTENDIDPDSDNTNSPTKLIMPIAMGIDQNTFYCLDFAENEERSVYEVNYKTNEQTLIYEADSFKIVDLILSNSNKQLIGVKVLKNAGLENIFFNENKNLKQTTSTPELVSAIGISNDMATTLLYREEDNQPGQYFLRNNQTKKERVIGSVYPNLDGKLKSKQIESSIKVEGLEIPYILTLPTTKNFSFPLIVMPHGGPIGIFDHRYFDLTTQYLAANGYAVLRVNFRGSSGHSSELKEAGKRQWGKLMLEDIYQSTLNVASRLDINQNKICVFGMSYGGYAATMLAIKHPELYKCAVNVAGVSDINLYLNSAPRSDAQEKWLNEYVGDTVNNYDSLKTISPAYLIKELTRPILIIHGAKDEKVDIEHAFRLKLMLEKYNKPYSWYVFENGEHNLGDVKDQLILFNKVKNFVESNLI